ncbi:MAG: TIGR01777 family protein [Deltaproteobacteria bacterium]|nr:TIGR01777 family protein [Deltaproteobacteria bacterium]
MRILITGGTGFVGRALVAQCVADGHHCTLLTRGVTEPILVSSQLTHRPWDPFQPGPWQAAVEGIDAVIHLAGESVAARQWSMAQRMRITQSRVVSTQLLVEAIGRAAQPPATLLCASAIGYYGDGGESWLTEAHAAGDDFLAQVCREWEAAARAATAWGTRVVSLRIGLVLGPNGGALARMLPAFRLGLGGRLGPGDQWMSWIHRDDLIALLCFALHDARVHGPVNAVSPSPVRNRDFTQCLAALLHRPAVCPLPAPLLRLLLGERAQLLLASQRVSAAHALALGFQFSQPELAGALRACVIR